MAKHVVSGFETSRDLASPATSIRDEFSLSPYTPGVRPAQQTRLVYLEL